jgi:hypothetical protein
MLKNPGRSAEKFLGRSCFRQHCGLRYVSNGDCVECAALRHENPRQGRGQYLSSLAKLRQLRGQERAHSLRLQRKRECQSGNSFE